MANGYNPYKDILAIYNSGNEWQSANQAQDETKKKAIADKAKQYYNNLSVSGYGDLANTLSQSDSNTRLDYAKQYGKKGKNAVRPYFYAMGEQYGLSRQDIDNNLLYDNQTGEVSFYGQKMQNPSAVIDGSAYYDTDVLDTTFNSMMDKMGKSKAYDIRGNQAMDTSQQYNQNAHNTSLAIESDRKTGLKNQATREREYNESRGKLEDFIYNPKTYTSPNAKALYSIYGEKGDIAAGDVTANLAGSNSGNVDSFAQANAKRQQLSFLNAANQAILDDYSSRLGAAYQVLDNLGVYHSNADKAYNNNLSIGMANTAQMQEQSSLAKDTANDIYGLAMADAKQKHDMAEESKVNNTNIQSILSGITGKTSRDITDSQNPFINPTTGKLRDHTQNFAEMRDYYKSIGDETMAAYANAAGFKKTQDYPEYAQYAKYFTVGEQPDTQAKTEFNMNDLLSRYGIDSQERTSKYTDDRLAQTASLGANVDMAGVNSKERISQAELAMDKYGIDKSDDLERYMFDKTNAGGTSSATGGTNVSDVKDISKLVESQMKEWNKYIDNNYKDKGDFKKSSLKIVQNFDGTYSVPDSIKEKLIIDIANNNSISENDKMRLIKAFNISDAVIDTVNTDPHYSSK